MEKDFTEAERYYDAQKRVKEIKEFLRAFDSLSSN
jgi:hypothetical protein